MNLHQPPAPPTLTRRRFHRTALGAAAGLAGAGLFSVASARADGGPAWTMRQSCSSIAFSSLPIEQAAERIARLGFEAIDVWSAHAGCPHLDDVLDRLGPGGLRKILEKNRLKLYAFSVYQGGYPKYAELLGACGGGVAVRGSTKPADEKELSARMKEFIESLKPEIELAHRHDSYLAVENHGRTLLNTLDSFKAFVDLNTDPRLGIALAPLHLQRLGASVEEAITIAGDQLLFFYAWQNAPGEEQLPGLGPTDCTAWIEALAKTDYRWYVNPFMHHQPAPDEMEKLMARSKKYLQECDAKRRQ